MKPHGGASTDKRPGYFGTYRGRIIDVDPLSWTCTVATEVSEGAFGKLYNVEITALYLHSTAGEGLYVMPDTGAAVYVTRPADNGPAFLSGYRAYPNKGVDTESVANKPSLAGNRPRMAPGDMAMLGRDGNGVVVQRGNLTVVSGSALARTLYLGRENTVHTIAGQLRSDTFGGSTAWLADRTEEDPDGHKATRFEARFKEYADDRGHVVQLAVGGNVDSPVEGEIDGLWGTHGAPPASLYAVRSPVLRLVVFADGDREEEVLSPVVSLAAGKDGKLEVVSKSNTALLVRSGAQTVRIELKPDGALEIAASSAVTVQAPTVRTTTGTVVVEQTTAGVSVGGGLAPVVIDNGLQGMSAAAWAEVAVLASALGVPVPNIAALITALASGMFSSSKLRSS